MSKERMVDDAGVFVVGARKHFIKGHYLTEDDLIGLARDEAHALVTKDNVWPVPDYERLVESGVNPFVVAALKVVRDKLPKSPVMVVRGTVVQGEQADNVRKDYIKVLTSIRKKFENATEHEIKYKTIVSDLVDELGGYDKNKKDEFYKLLSTISTNYKIPWDLNYIAMDKIFQLSKKGFKKEDKEKVDPWMRGIIIRKYKDGDGNYFCAFKANGKKILSRGRTEEEVTEEIKKIYEEEKDNRKEPPVRPDDIDMQRKSIRREDTYREITPEEFIETFGFRAIQFGNSIPDKERSEIIKKAYDALMDLASILGIDPVKISLNGFLAVSFGARGRGRFPAHYEPVQRIFNIGRLNGAGSLAHEWFHGFDHFLKTMEREGNGEIRYASEVIYRRDNEKSRILNIGKTMIKKEMTKEEYIENTKKRIEEKETKYNNLVKNFNLYKENRGKSLTRADNNYINKMDIYLKQEERILSSMKERIEKIDEKKVFGESTTEYYKNAISLNGKSGDYWSRAWELMARAFESWVFDRLAQEGTYSPFLVHGVEGERYSDKAKWKGNPYPEGQERENINLSFDANIKEIVKKLDEEYEKRLSI